MLALLLAASSFTGTDPAAIARAEAAFAMTSTPAPAPPRKTVQQVVMHVAGNGHTHACPNKDCPFRKAHGEPYVWGGANHDHVCPYCNTEQTVTSNRPRTVVRALEYQTVATSPQEFLSLASLQGSLVSSSSACASGQCSTMSSPKRGFGFFRR